MKVTRAGMKLKLKRCEIRNNLLLVKEKIYISQNEEVYSVLIKQVHDSTVNGHVDREIIYNRIARWYYWPRMTHTVDQYVKACHLCRRTKFYREAKQKLLNPLPIPERYFQDISVNFIIELPKCLKQRRTYEHIMVVVNRLSKKKKFIALNSLEVETVIQTFLKWIWRKESYFETIVSDKETQFISHFWTRLCKKIGTKLKLSTAWHPKTNEQTENANADLKIYLRAYVNYKQNDWINYLPIAEFETNSVKSASTGIKPFLTTKEYLSRSEIKSAELIVIDNSIKRREMRNANKLVTKLKNLKEFLRAEIKWAQAKQKKFANMHRAPVFEFRISDMIMLNAKFQATRRQSKSINFKNLGPYRVINKIDRIAYKLELPVTMTGVFSVFHFWLLHFNDGIPLQGQKETEPKPANSQEDQWKINEIIKSKIDRRRNDPKTESKRECLRYLVR